MNNVVDEVLNTAATDNKIKYRITKSDNTYEDVTIDLITPVTTEGTALNKVLFDSIKDDLNSRLLISNKATQAEAEAGTNDTKYMTPLKVKKQIQAQIDMKTLETATGGTGMTKTDTLIDLTGVSDKVIAIEGRVTGDAGNSPYNAYANIVFNGTSVSTDTINLIYGSPRNS